MKRNKKPWWARRRESCPECGYVTNDIELFDMGKTFSCPRCKTSYSMEEFEELNYDKYSEEAIIE